MVSSSDLLAIVEGAQAAALDDTLWEGWAQGIMRRVGSTGGILGVVDQHRKIIERPHPFFEHIKGFEEYMGGMIAQDPQLRKCLSARGTEVYTDADHIDLSDRNVAEYMRWQEARLNFCTHITMTAQVDAGHMAAFSIHFSRDDAPRARQLRDAWQSILPDVSNAMRLGFSLSHLLSQAYWDGTQVQSDHRPSFLLADTGRVMFLNQAAEELVRAGTFLRLRAGTLTATLPAQNARLQLLIHSGTRTSAPRGGVVHVPSSTGGPGHLMELFPVHRVGRVMAVAEPAALLVLTAPKALSPLVKDRLREALGLTETEARTAVHLSTGRSDEDIARAMGVAVSTVRSHVRAILAKAGVRTKAELAHLLTLVAR